MAKKVNKSNSADFKLKPLSAAIKVNAIAAHPSEKNKSGCFLVVAYKDIDDETRQLLIPSSIVDDLRRLKSLLLENCFPFNLPKEEWEGIQEILKIGSEQRMQLVEGPGFYGNIYLLANNELIGEISEEQLPPILDPNSKVPLKQVERKGTLRGWQTQVANSALLSSRIMLAIAAAFSPYLLVIVNIEKLKWTPLSRQIFIEFKIVSCPQYS